MVIRLKWVQSPFLKQDIDLIIWMQSSMKFLKVIQELSLFSIDGPGTLSWTKADWKRVSRIGLVSRPLYTQEPNLFPPYKRKLQENFINLFVNTGSSLRAIQTKLNQIKYWMKWISKKLWKLYRMRYQYSIGPDNRLI